MKVPDTEGTMTPLDAVSFQLQQTQTLAKHFSLVIAAVKITGTICGCRTNTSVSEQVSTTGISRVDPSMLSENG